MSALSRGPRLWKEYFMVVTASASLSMFSGTNMADADAVDSLVIAEMNRQQIPGLTLAVVRNGEIVKAQGYGFANIEHQVPAKRETVYQAGSIGKQFTATAVMLLVEEGKLGLNDPLGKYFPDCPKSWNEITIGHLLTHTSGIQEHTLAIDLRQDRTEDELLHLAYTCPIEFPPGSAWRYSNAGYMVLGILVSKVAGKFYGDFLQERVFHPLEMETTSVINEANIIPNRAAGYRLSNGEIKNQEWVAPSLNTTADGSLYLTVNDLIKWDASLSTEKILKKSSLQRMWTPAKTSDGQVTRYGFGWFIDRPNGHLRLHHSGAWQGFSSYFDRYPDDKVTVIVLTNLAAAIKPGEIGAVPEKIASGVASIYIPGLAGT